MCHPLGVFRIAEVADADADSRCALVCLWIADKQALEAIVEPDEPVAPVVVRRLLDGPREGGVG